MAWTKQPFETPGPAVGTCPWFSQNSCHPAYSKTKQTDSVDILSNSAATANTSIEPSVITPIM